MTGAGRNSPMGRKDDRRIAFQNDLTFRTALRMAGSGSTTPRLDALESWYALLDAENDAQEASLTNLAQSIAAEQNARQQADTAEIAARQAADNAEAMARANADAAEVTARNNAITAAQNAEAAARAYADTQEGQARVAGDAALQSQITALPHKFATTIGNGILTSFDIAHNLNTRDIVVQVYSVSTGGLLTPATVTIQSVNVVRLTFLLAVANGGNRVVIVG
jgi:hypothetical protein